MNQEYFDKMSDVIKKSQEPMQAMAELNMKTMQNMCYMKPEDLSKMKKPEDFMEKQLEIAIANGNKAMEYMQKSFQIMEKLLLSMAKESKSKNA